MTGTASALVRGVLVGATALLLAACSSTVTGHGAATQQSSRSGFPATPSGGSSAPSTAPPTTTPPSAPSSTTSVGRAPAPITYTDTAGHFRVLLPGKPETTDQPGSYGGYTFHVHVAAVRTPYVVLVEGEDVSPALDASGYNELLTVSTSTFGDVSGMTKGSDASTTFRGHSARNAVFDRAGTRYELLVFVYSGSRTYFLFAPQGAKFNSLVGSFQPLP